MCLGSKQFRLEDLRNHSPEQLAELRLLLASDAPLRPDPQRRDIFELEGPSHVFYVLKYPRHEGSPDRCMGAQPKFRTYPRGDQRAGTVESENGGKIRRLHCLGRLARQLPRSEDDRRGKLGVITLSRTRRNPWLGRLGSGYRPSLIRSIWPNPYHRAPSLSRRYPQRQPSGGNKTS